MHGVLLTAALLTALPFEARTLDGNTVAGELRDLSNDGVTLAGDSGPEVLRLSSLALLSPQTPREIVSQASPWWVELRDGSGFPATSFEVKDGAVRAESSLKDDAKLRTRDLHWVRYARAADEAPKLAKQWDDITRIEAAGDLLVVKKDDAFDYLEGVVRDIDENTCKFELDGDVIPVKLTKVAGIVYAKQGSTNPPDPIGKLIMADGSHYSLSDVHLADDQLDITTTAGARCELQLASVVRFDFTSGKIAFLSDLEPESVKFTPLVGFEQATEGLLGFYQYRRDAGFDQSPLQLDGHVYRKGLSLATRTELIYRLPAAFRQFHAVVGIDDSTRETGSVRLEIRGDGKLLWEGEVKGTGPPQTLELPISGVRRLEILADYGEGLDVGDRLDLCDAQVTK